MYAKYAKIFKSVRLEKRRKRICLGCLKEFLSNWIGNRKCRCCKVLEKRTEIDIYADNDHRVNLR